MPVRFTQGEIAALLSYLRLRPARKGSNTFVGIGRDGQLRRCYFHFHSEATQVATGTAAAIAHQLGFPGVAEMKDFIARHL